MSDSLLSLSFSSCCDFSNLAVPYTPLSFMLPLSGVLTYVSRGSDTAVAEEPSFGMRMRIIVSVFVASSSPARSMLISFLDSGLPFASVRESTPTSRMSVAPSGWLPRFRLSAWASPPLRLPTAM